MAPNKTDGEMRPWPQRGRESASNDADGLAQLAEGGFFREGRVKGDDSLPIRTPVAARARLVRITTALSNQIRGLMETFGLVVRRGKDGTLEAEVRRLLTGQEDLARIILPVLGTWRSVRARAAGLGRQLLASARQSEPCQRRRRSPGSVRSPQPRSRPPSRTRRTSGRRAPLAHGWG